MKPHLGRIALSLAWMVMACGSSTSSGRRDSPADESDIPIRPDGAGATSAGTAGDTGDPTDHEAPGGAGGRATTDPPNGVDEPTNVDCCAADLMCTPGLHPTCEQLASGRWQCACGTGFAEDDRIFQTDEPTGSEACSLAGSICSWAELSLDLERCTDLVTSSTAEGCQAELTCERRIADPFVQGASAWLIRTPSASCERQLGSKMHDCECDELGGTKRYQVSSSTTSQACEPFLNFCQDWPQPVIDGPITCQVIDSALTPSSCRSLESCGHTLYLAPSATVVETGWEVGWECLPGSAGPECTCWMPDTALTFQSVGLSGSVPTARVCQAAASLCRDEARATPSGSPDCQATDASTSVNQCYTESTCLVPATLSGLAVTVKGKLSVRCDRVNVNGIWSCACASNKTSGAIDVVATDPTDACASAVPGCLELIGVSVAPYPRNEPSPSP
jgi:hypothetical protein